MTFGPAYVTFQGIRYQVWPDRTLMGVDREVTRNGKTFWRAVKNVDPRVLGYARRHWRKLAREQTERREQNPFGTSSYR